MLHRRLAQLEKEGRPIRVGIIGAGTFGTQIVAQTCRMKGMRVAAIADLKPERAVRALGLGGVPREDVRVAKTAGEIDRAMDEDRPAVTAGAEELLGSRVDVVVEATGVPEVGAANGYRAIRQNKHLVMVTVEADILVGSLLKRMADRAGLLYSMAYGDEPALAAELCDWARTLGFKLIASGKGTRFKLAFRKANPDDVPRMYGFKGKDYNASMFCSFLDGTKHSIEMAALSNATGLVPDIRGMHFPTADLARDPRQALPQGARRRSGEPMGVVEAVSSIFPDDTPVERSLRGGLYAVVEGQDDYPGGVDGLLRRNHRHDHRRQEPARHDLPPPTLHRARSPHRNRPHDDLPGTGGLGNRADFRGGGGRQEAS